MRTIAVRHFVLKTFFAAVLGAVVALPARATSMVNIQPVNICLGDGTDCGGPAFDLAAVKAFWQTEAGLTLNFLSTRNFNNTALQTINSTAEIENFLLNPSADPLASASPFSTPITFWYSDADLSLQIVSRGIIGGNRSWVISNLTGDLTNIGFSRALAFNLGLDVTDGSSNLMFTLAFIADKSLDDLHLDDAQRARIAESRFVEDAPSQVPVPTAGVLFASALAGGWLCRRRWTRRAA